mgnify:CR=1 FL=1
MNVDKIYVNTYKGDNHWCHICVASIRFWYPNIQITLIKDVNKGNFDISYLEKKFNVQVFNSNEKYGWGYGKLEPLFLSREESFLVLDSDTVLTGPVLDLVKNVAEYLALDCVAAVGGSWMVSREKLQEERFDQIESDTKDALVLARSN